MMKNTMMIILLSSTLAFPFTASAARMGAPCVDKDGNICNPTVAAGAECTCIKGIKDRIKDIKSDTTN